MKQITYKQLAFILKCPIDDARRMCAFAEEKENGSTVKTWNDHKAKASFNEDDYSHPVDVDVLSRNLNIPHLQLAVDDICNNYLKRGPTKAYIYQYPEAIINKRIRDAGSVDKMISHYKPEIPSVLKSFFSKETIQTIYDEWRKRYGHYKFVTIPEL